MTCTPAVYKDPYEAKYTAFWSLAAGDVGAPFNPPTGYNISWFNVVGHYKESTLIIETRKDAKQRKWDKMELPNGLTGIPEGREAKAKLVNGYGVIDLLIEFTKKRNK